MSFSDEPLILSGVLIGGGLAVLAASLWRLRGATSVGKGALPARLLFVLLGCAVGGGAIWTGLYLVRPTRPALGPLPPPAALARPARIPVQETTGDLIFYRDVNVALERARATGRPLLIDFFATWCDPCRRWNRMAAAEGELKVALREAVLARVHDTDPAFDAFLDHPDHEPLRRGLPYFLVLDPTGGIRYQSNDYRDTRGLIRALQKDGADGPGAAGERRADSN